MTIYYSRLHVRELKNAHTIFKSKIWAHFGKTKLSAGKENCVCARENMHCETLLDSVLFQRFTVDLLYYIHQTLTCCGYMHLHL